MPQRPFSSHNAAPNGKACPTNLVAVKFIYFSLFSWVNSLCCSVCVCLFFYCKGSLFKVFFSKSSVWVSWGMFVIIFFPSNGSDFSVSLDALWYYFENEIFEYYSVTNLAFKLSPLPRVCYLLIITGCSYLFNDLSNYFCKTYIPWHM